MTVFLRDGDPEHDRIWTAGYESGVAAAKETLALQAAVMLQTFDENMDYRVLTMQKAYVPKEQR